MANFTGFVVRDLSGYEWAGDSLRAKNLTAYVNWYNRGGRSDLIKPPAGFEAYDPLEREPALFQIALAQLGDSKDPRAAILRFANSWGNVEREDIRVALGTPIAVWQQCVARIRTIEHTRLRPIPMNEKYVPTWLTFLTSHTKLRYKVERQFGRIQSKIIVAGLLECLVIQAIEANVNNAAFNPCKFCGMPFSVTDSREGKMFCSDSCRVQEYKRRKKTAVEMRATGCTLREISAKTRTPIKQVKTWLGE